MYLRAGISVGDLQLNRSLLYRSHDLIDVGGFLQI